MDSTTNDRWEPPDRESREAFIANVTKSPDGWTCTISPVPEDAHGLLSEWVSATEESFVALEDMR